MQKCANLVDPETKWMLKNESTLSIRRVDAAANEPQVPEIRVPVNQNRLPVIPVNPYVQMIYGSGTPSRMVSAPTSRGATGSGSAERYL